MTLLLGALVSVFQSTIGASMITYTILEAPCYSYSNYSIMGPKTLF